MPEPLKYILSALPVAAAIAALGTSRGWLAWAIAAAALLAVLVLRYVLQHRQYHRLTEGTGKFVSFYKNWYARGGWHFIYCDDLAWLDDDENEPIVRQLKTDGSRAHIWIRDASSPRVEEFRSAGVQVGAVPEFAEIHVPMSLHKHDDARQLILRAKSGYGRKTGRQTIDFIETTDRYLVALADEFFRFCEHMTGVQY